MKNITIYEKGTAKVLTQDLVNKHYSVYKVNLDSAEIAKIVKVNNNLEVYLQNGEKVVIDDFFIGEKPKEFTIETSDGKHYLLNFLEFDASGTVTKIDYLGIADFEEYLVGEHSAVPAWAWVAAAAGVIGIAAASGGSGGSNHSGSGDKTGPKLTYDILDNQKIKITADEASKITIVDASGKTIGSGQLNQAGALEINLTRPLVDNEKITITATDNAGNKTTETINVGDVTKPDVEINIIDNDTIQVNSNEPGSKVIIKNEAGQIIAEGVIGPDGKLIVDLNTPLTDGSKIIVDVIDAAGNQTEKVITVGDVTPPNISTTIKDATHIQVTSNEAGQVKITDSHGNVIGTGTITGNNTVDNIQLTRPLTDGEKVTVTVTDGAGNPKAIEITAGDVTAPVITTTIQDATHVEVTSNEIGQVKITDSSGNVIGTGTATGNGVVDNIQLTRPLTDGEKITVTVTDGAGNPKAIEITAGDVTNPQFQSSHVDSTGTQLTLTYSETLDPLHPPVAGNFTVTVDGQVVPVTGVTVNGSTVVLTLGTPVTAGQAVQVGYTDPSAANDPNAIQDIAGNDAATLPATTVDNGSTVPGGDTTAPTFVSAALDTAGTSLTLTYSEALDSNNLPPLNSFVVTADGQVVPVTGVTVNGSTVVLTLGTPVTAGQAVQVGYTDPSAANDPNAIQDIAGNDAATLPATTVDNGSTVPGGDTTAPTFVSAALDTAGTSLTLTYSEALDGNNLPPLNSFVVTADGQVVPVTGVTVNGSTVVLTLGTPVTAGQAVQVGYTDPSAANDPNAIQDIAGNDAATLPATTVDNGSTVPGGDTTAPTFVSAALDTAGTSLTLTYSEALDSNNLPPLNSFVVTADGQVVPVTGVTVNGSTVVLTLGTPVTAGQAVQVGYTDPSAANDPNAIQDIAGNDAATLPATTVDNGSTVPGGDTTAPTFVSAALDTAGTSLTLTYSEALDGNNLPPLNSFVVTADGQVVPVTGVTVNGSTVVLTLGTPVTAGQAVQVGYTDPSAANDPNAIQDIAGNDAATLPATTVDNGSTVPGGDTTAPTFVSAALDTAGTSLTLTYSEALDGNNLPPLNSFVVTADGQVVPVTGVTVNGSTVVLTLGAPVTLGQAVQVGYTDPTAGNDPNAIQDIAGNDAVTLPPTSVTNGSVIPSDTTAPTFVNATVDPLGTTLTLNYNEALDPLNPPVAGDFAVTADGQVVAITGVLVVGSSVVLTLGAPVTLGQAVQVGYTDPTAGNDPNAIQDIAGNDAVTLPPTSVTNGSVIPSDTTAPTFVNATVDPLGTTLTLNYNEALDPLNPPVAGDFAVTADGQVVAITGVLVVGSSVVLTLGAPVTLGQAVQVGYTDPTAGNDPNAIQDIAGNDAVTLPPTSVTNGSVIPSDTTAPTFVNATVDPLGTTLTLNYNEALDPLNPPVAGDFAVTADGQVVAITGVLVVGSSVVLTLGAPVTLGQAVQVGYTDPTAGNDPNAIQDIAGNDAVTLPPTSVTNGSVIPSDTTAPTFVNATVDPLGTTLTLNYNEALDPLNPPVAGDFAVTADGQVVAITGVLVVGSSVVLTLGAPVTLGQAVQVGYTDPTAGNDPNAIQDIAGNDAVTLPPTSVTNGSVIPSDTTAPTFVNATVDPLGTTLTLNYNEALDPLNPPVAGDFAVTADGQVVAITGVLVVGSSVVLTLGAPVTLGQAVQVGYTDPTAGNDPNAIQDIAGNDAVTLPPTSVTNGSVIPSDTTAPTFVNATVDPLGTTLTLNYNEALDPLNPPVAGDFAVTADGQVVAITGVLVVGSSVVLTLGAPVTLGQAVQVGYTDPTAGNDPNAIQDIAGNDAVTLPPTSVTNGSVIPSDTTAPTFVNATVDPLGTTLTLNYNEALDPLNPPVAGDFAVTADGQVVAITGVLVVGSSVVLTLGAPVTLGQAVQVGYTDPTAGNDPNAIQDIAGNDAVTLPPTSVTNGSVIPSDTTAPTFVNATVDPLGTTLTLNYNEALDPLNPPVAGDFAVTADGQVVAITSVLVVGSSVVLTLGAPVTLGQAVQVGYTDPTAGNDPNAIQDIAGNDAVTLPPTSVTNGSVIPSDTTAPTFVNATVDPLGTTLTLNYNEALDPLNPPVAGDFAVTADGQVVAITGVLVVGSSVVLTLGAPVTLGQAVQVGYTDPTAGNDPNAIQDIAGNDAVTLPPTSVTNGSVIPSDTTAPTFVNATVDPLGTTLTLNYNEALDPLNPPVAGDFAVTADGQVVAITGVLVVGSSVVLTLGAPVTLGQAVQVGYTDPTAGNDPNAIQDIAGNDAVTLPPTSVTNGSVIPSDTTAPTFVNATVDPLGTTLTLNYNEALDPLNPPVAGDFAVTADGQVVAITSVLVVGSSVVLTLGAPVTLGQAVQVGYTDPTAGNDPNAIQDIAGNDAVTLPPTSVTNGSVIPSDTTAPTFVNATVDPLGTTLTLNYNEALDPLNPPVAGDFAVTADGQVVAITGVLVVGSSVVLTLGAPVTLGQAVQVGYTDPTAGNDPNAIQDIAGNDAVTLPPTSVTNGSVIPSDTTAPTFVNATVDPLGTTLTLNYNEALDPLNPPVAGDFAVTADGQVVAITSVLVVGSSVVLTLGAPVTLGQAVQVGYTDPTAGNDPNAIQDIAGNDAVTLPPTSVTNGSVIPSDTTAPTFVNATVDPLGTTLTLNYNEALDPLNPPVAGDFAVTADGQVVAITSVLVVGSSVVLTLGAPVTLGQAVQVGYTDPTAGNDPNAIQDIAGNDAVTLPPTSVTNGSVIPSDTTAPTFVNATVDPLGTTLTLNYNEALDPLNPPVAGDFAVTADGQVVAITSVLVVGSSVVLTLGAPVTLGQAVQVGYTDPTAGNDPNAIQDIAGNDAVTLPPTSVTNGSVIPSDTTAPTFVNATVDPLGTTLTLNYNEALDPLNPPVAGDFAVTADGQVVAITSVLVVGSSVVLTLGAPVTLGQAVQVGYTDPTAGNDPNAIQDIAGNDAVTLPPTSVTNGSVIPSDTTAPTFVNATVDPLGTTLTLNYNEALDPLNPPVAGDFAVTADGQVVAITSVLVVGSSVVLTLGAPVTLGQAVQVGYTDPTAGNDPNAIQDIAGNDAVTLPPTSVTNGSVIPSDTTAPTFVNATVDPLGTTLTLNYNEALDPLNPPVAGDFAVTADGQVVAITSVLVVGSSVVLTLGAPVTLGQAVQVGYTDPTAGNDPNAIQDIAGNDAVTLPPTSVTNGSVIPSDTTAPTFVNATVDPLGTTLTLNYNEALDPLNPPVAGDFAVTADGQVVAITSVLVVGSSVVLTLGAPVTLGQAVQVGYTDPTAGNDPNAIQDIAGNDAVTLPPTSVTNGSVIPSDTTAPTFVNATVDPLGTTLTLNYNEALDPLNPPVAGDFAVTADGQVVAITGVLVVGSSVVLTLGAPVTLGQAVQVGYTDPTAGNDPNAIQDIAGNDAVTLPPTSVTNGSVIPSDTTAPTFVNATVDPLGTTLTLNYNEALDPLNPPVAGDFAVTADGQVVAITGVLVVGSSVVLTLGAPVTLGQAVQVGYTDPTAGNDPNAIQDIAGNDAVTLPPTSVTNGSVIPSDTTAPTFVNATVDPLGTTLTLNYNEALDPLNPPVAGDFAVTADGQVVAITGVLVVGSSVVLTLGAPVTLGQAVQVGYTDPTAGNDPNAIQDIAGNDAVTLPPTSVTNGSIVIPPLNAVNDEFALNLGQEVRVNRTEVAGSDIAVVDILGNNATGLNFSIPQTPGSAGKGATGNISVTVSQQDLISVGEAVQIVIYQQTTNGPVEVARGTSQGGIVTVGGIGIIGVVNSNDSIKLDFTNLPEGDYTVAVQADDSALTTLLKDVAITDLGGEGEILGASNAAAIGAAINTVLGPLGAPVLALVNTILIPVNTLGLPLSSVVNQLLNVLPISVIDYIVDAAVAPLLSNLLTIYEKTNISVTGTEEVFANYAVTGNVFADNGNGQDVVGGGSITEIDGASVAQGSVTIQGEYGSLEINTLTGVFTYTVTAGEAAVGKTEIFDYKLSNGATSDTAQIIINIAGTPADPGELTPPDYVDQVVARDDLATVKNYHESVGDDVGVHGRASQLLGVNLLGLNISLGNTVPFNFEVEENSTSSIHVNVSGSVVSAAIGGLIGALLGTADKFFNAVLERQYVDENGVIQKEHFIVEDAVKLTPPGLLGIIFNYSGQINLDNLPPGVYTIALQEKPTDSGLLQQILNLLDSTASAQLFGGVELTMQDQTNKYLGSSTIEGNVISSVDGADEVNTTTFVTKVANEVGDPAVTLSGGNTVVVGAYGTLYISPNGHYKYVSNGDPADIGKVDTFTYTIRDFNGSEATANLNIRIDGDNSGVVWDNTNPENDVSLPAPIILDNAEHVAIGAVTNVVQIVSEANQGASFAVAGTLGGGGGTYVPTTFNVANTDSSHVVVKVNIPPLSVSLLPTIVLTIKDQNGTVVGTITGKPLLNALGSSITVDMPNLGPGTYTITASASGNIGLGFNATVSLAQDITHYNEIAPVTAAPIIGNMLTDDTYNPSYAKFSIDTGNGQFVEVGYNGVTVQGEYGSLFVKSDGSYVYTPSAGVIGRQEVFDYKLSVFGQDHTASLTVTVDAITTGDALRNTLISGELNDTFTGNAGSDVLVYHVLESASASGGNGIDHWTDFHSGNVNTDTNADIIDISDLLIGFNSANITADLTASANYLKNYLGVRVDGNNVTLTIDRDGAGTTYTGKTDLLQLDNLAQSGAAFNGKTEDDILKLLLQNHQLVL